MQTFVTKKVFLVIFKSELSYSGNFPSLFGYGFPLTLKSSGGSVVMTNKKAWSVVFAWVGINLALGILYTWSIFKSVISSYIDQGGVEGSWSDRLRDWRRLNARPTSRRDATLLPARTIHEMS